MKPTNEQRLRSARKLRKTAIKNIEFLKKRIEIQDSHEDWWNKGRFEKSGGQWSERTYSQFDVQQEKEKLDKYNEVINELE